MRTIRIVFCFMLVAFAASHSYAQEPETKDYRVHSGDTLWGISAKELRDSFLWPKIWKENPQVKNPDMLYPGQTIRIPVYLLRKDSPEEAAPAIAPGPERKIVIVQTPVPPAPELRPIVEKNLLIASGYISPSVQSVGIIAGSPSGRNLFGNMDLVYVRTSVPAQPGDKFFILRTDQIVHHPVSQRKIGYIVQIVGIAEVERIEFGEMQVRIIQSFSEIVSGDQLQPYYEITPPAMVPPFRKPALSGIILASKHLRLLNTNSDIVFLDKGARDGLAPGDVFRVIDTSTGHGVDAGSLQIISERDTTSTAIILNATEPVTAGNLFIQAQ